ncbi:hypothetical protein [Helicobacter pylori]
MLRKMVMKLLLLKNKIWYPDLSFVCKKNPNIKFA